MSNLKSKMLALGIDSVKYAANDAVSNAVISTTATQPNIVAMGALSCTLEHLADNAEDAHLKGLLYHTADFAAQVALKSCVSGLRTNPLIDLKSIFDMSAMQPKLDAMDAGKPVRMSAQETKQHVEDVTEEVTQPVVEAKGSEDVAVDNAVENNIPEINQPVEDKPAATQTTQYKCALCGSMIAKNSTKHAVVEQEVADNTVIEKLKNLGGETICKKCNGSIKNLLNQEKNIIPIDASLDEIRSAMGELLADLDKLSKEIDTDEALLKKEGKNFAHKDVYEDRIKSRRESLQTIQTKYDELTEFESAKAAERAAIVIRLNGGQVKK